MWISILTAFLYPVVLHACKFISLELDQNKKFEITGMKMFHSIYCMYLAGVFLGMLTVDELSKLLPTLLLGICLNL